MKPIIEVRTIRVDLARGSQDFLYTETMLVRQQTCRLRIRSDSHSFQCYALAEVWAGAALCWNPVAGLHYSLMRTREGLAYVEAVTSDSFRSDREALLRRLVDVLEGPDTAIVTVPEPTEADLCAEFENFVTQHGFSGPGDAVELLLRTDLTREQRLWLSDFVLRWDATIKRGQGS